MSQRQVSIDDTTLQAIENLVTCEYYECEFLDSIAPVTAWLAEARAASSSDNLLRTSVQNAAAAAGRGEVETPYLMGYRDGLERAYRNVIDLIDTL